MRKSFLGLLVLTQRVFTEQDPYSESLFVFVNRLDNKLINDQRVAGNVKRDVECRRRLGGILNYYYRRAA
jgi:hypothetical protein